jgi:hypothetical protein
MKTFFAILAISLTAALTAGQAFAHRAGSHGCMYQGYPCDEWYRPDGY